MLTAAPLLFALTFPGRVPMESQAVFSLSTNRAPRAAVSFAFPGPAPARVEPVFSAISHGRTGYGFPRFELGAGFEERLSADAGQREAKAVFFLKKLDSLYGDYSEQLLSVDKPLDYRLELLKRRIARTPRK